MAHYVEPMDVDDNESDFDNKENTFHHSNLMPRTPCTEKGYEELDVSELNMKLRYSITPAASPMSKSMSHCLDNRYNASTDESLNNTVINENENNLTRSLHSALNKTETKSPKVLPLQSLPADLTVESNRNTTILQPLATTIDNNDITITVSNENEIDNLSFPSSSSSMAHTPEATTPTKEIPKDGGSPIMRGLKSVLSMFRSSQSPIPPAEGEHKIVDAILSPADVQLPDSLPQATASTPIHQRNKEKSLSRRNSPHKESLVFNEDLEKELQWNDDSTIVFSTEKIPIHKLFFQDKPASSKADNLQQPVNEDINSSVEYMDISYNDVSMKERTLNATGNKSTITDVPESDGEFVDCETTITQDECQAIIEQANPDTFDFKQQNDTEKVLAENKAAVNEMPFLDTTVDILKLIDGSQIDLNADQTVKQLDFSTTDIVNQLSDLINASETVESNVSLDEHKVSLSNTEAPKTIGVLEQTVTEVQPKLLENLVASPENTMFPENIIPVNNPENVSIVNDKIESIVGNLPSAVTDSLNSNIEPVLPLISSAPDEVDSTLTHEVTSNATEINDTEILKTVEEISDSMPIYPSPCDIPLPNDDFNDLTDILVEENLHAEMLTKNLAIFETAQNTLLAALNKTIELTPDTKLEHVQTENETETPDISCQLSLLPSDGPLPDMDDNHSVETSSLSHEAATIIPDPVQPQPALTTDVGTVVDNTDSVNNTLTVSPNDNTDNKVTNIILPEVSTAADIAKSNEPEMMEMSYCEPLAEKSAQNEAMDVTVTTASSVQLDENVTTAVSPKKSEQLCIENLPSEIEFPEVKTQEINIVSEEDIVIGQNETKLSEPTPAITTENSAIVVTSDFAPVVANLEISHNVEALSNPNVVDEVTSSVFDMPQAMETSSDPSVIVTKSPYVKIDETNILEKINNLDVTYASEEIGSITPSDMPQATETSSDPSVIVTKSPDVKIDESNILEKINNLDVTYASEEIGSINPSDMPQATETSSDPSVIVTKSPDVKIDETNILEKINNLDVTHASEEIESITPSVPGFDVTSSAAAPLVENIGKFKRDAPITEEINISEPQNDLPQIHLGSNTEEIVEKQLQPEEKIDEEIVLSENSSPFVSLSAEEELGIEVKTANSVDTVNPTSDKPPSPPLSPKIVSKGYNLNFDDLDAMNPFATKTKIRLSPPPGASPNTSLEPLDDKKNEKSETFAKEKNYNRRKTMQERNKPLKAKRNFNSTFDSTESAVSKRIEPENYKDLSKKDADIKRDKSQISDKANTDVVTPVTDVVTPQTSNLDETYQVTDKVDDSHTNTTLQIETHEHNPNDTIKIVEDVVMSESCKSPVKSDNTSSSEQSTYFSAATSSTDCNSIESKNVFNLPEIDDKNFNPFATKSKICQTPPPDEDMENPFATKSKIKSSPETSFVITPNNANTTDTVDTESEFKEENHNLSNCSGSSRTSDEKDVTVQEVHTEDEDTIEGPFLEADDNNESNKIPEFNDAKRDSELNKLNAQANEDDAEPAEMFIDAEAFEFLMNQNNTDEVAYSGKESLFLKFDPLFARRVTSEGVAAALTEIKKRQSIPKKMAKPMPPKTEELMSFDKQVAGPSNFNNTHTVQSEVDDIQDDLNITVLSKPMMAVTPAVNPVVTPKKSVTPTRANRLSMTFTSPAMAVIDRLLSFSSPSAGAEADQDLTQLRELLAEKEISVYNLRCESKELQNRLSSLEAQTKSLEAVSAERLQKINELTENLAEKTKTNRSMAAVVEEYERTIASLISETEQDKKRYAEERMQLIRDRDEQTAHLTSMEVSFSDLHSKYEKSKQVIMGYKSNEEAYKNSIKEFEDNLAKMHSNYELLKQHATSKLNHANQELEKLNKAHEAEVVKYNAMIKRKDLHITSLEESLAQKTKANEELTAICDELINKVG